MRPFSGIFATAGAALRRDERGSVAMIAAIVFPALIGGMGLGAEVGSWYVAERKLQNAADVAAYAAAVRLNQGEDIAKVTPVALNVAKQSGFQVSGGIKVYHPVVGGAVQKQQVRVDLTESIDPLFSSFFGGEGATVHGSATARINGNPKPACLIALASGPETLRITGNGAMTLNGCVAVANSTSTQGIYVHGSGTLVADCVYSGSGHAHDHKENSLVTICSPEIQEDEVENPYEDLPAPPMSATCYNRSKKSDPMLPTPRLIGGVNYYDLCSLEITENVTLPAGVYIVYGGDITDTGQNTVTGTDVTFYLTAKASAPTDFARIDVNGAKLNIKAPTGTAYPYPGVVFFTDEASTVTHSFGGNSALQIQGALYTKKGILDYGGGGSAMGCAQIIASKINITGNGGVGYDCAGKGLTTVTAGIGGTVELFE